MVDFSCALKLAMPLAVLSAIREASCHHITVKGGKFMEAVAEADTIVFDKTGTLTKARPAVVDVVTFENRNKNEMLRIAACLEEHFPHSMANAVVQESVLSLIHIYPGAGGKNGRFVRRSYRGIGNCEAVCTVR